MVQIKILRTFYWIIILTVLICLIRAYAVNWLQTQTYLVQHGSLTGSPIRCYPLPPSIVALLGTVLIATAFFWTRTFKRKVEKQSVFTSKNYIELILLSVVFIVPFVIFDIKLLQLIFNTLREYTLAQPIGS